MDCKSVAVRLSRFDSYRSHRDLHSGCNVDYGVKPQCRRPFDVIKKRHHPLGISVMVAQQILVLSVQVRFLYPQHLNTALLLECYCKRLVQRKDCSPDILAL